MVSNAQTYKSRVSKMFLRNLSVNGRWVPSKSSKNFLQNTSKRGYHSNAQTKKICSNWLNTVFLGWKIALSLFLPKSKKHISIWFLLRLQEEAAYPEWYARFCDICGSSDICGWWMILAAFISFHRVFLFLKDLSAYHSTFNFFVLFMSNCQSI